MSPTLQRNLAALERVDPDAADRVRRAQPSDRLHWLDSKVPAMPAATLEPGDGPAARRVTLASRHRPDAEARRLADSADIAEHAAIVMLGFALGYHARPLAQRVRGHGVLVLYEPDTALLRAVLERLDYADVLADPAVVLLTGELDDSDLTARLERHFGAIAQGAQYITHPVTRGLHAEAIKTFMDRFGRLVAFCRTNVATTLANAAVTCRNLAANAGQYAAGETVNALRGAAAGRPAVLVAAGPSLARNVHLLAEPGVRDRTVIIAAQTALRPLLDRGVRPHYVTALDYHEISRRFYENLPPDAAQITLVAEPKANPAILDGFPGPIRLLHNKFLDLLLGPLARPIDPIPPGSTVAHLSFYLAQHLGCDPIILTGQDLGFSDGLYYCPGTAIHDVWSTELNPFNTLEMLEWKRIVRHRAHLKRLEDVHGRPMYSDEQMLTYLAQFERDFAAAGQTIIDATEGGLPKQHTQRMPLAEALSRFATAPLPPLPACDRTLDRDRLSRTADHLAHRLREVGRLQALSRKTVPVLEAMLDGQKDPARMNRLFRELDALKRQVAELNEAFELVNALNQVGAFNRIRADRSLRVAQAGIGGYDRQARQIERDIRNVRWIIDGCDEAIAIFTEARSRIERHFDTAPPPDRAATLSPPAGARGAA